MHPHIIGPHVGEAYSIAKMMVAQIRDLATVLTILDGEIVHKVHELENPP